MSAPIESAAQFLLAARKRGAPGARMPDPLRPTTIDDALAIQRRVTELTGAAIGGYKCSVPTEPRPVAYAPIAAPTIAVSSPMTVSAPGPTLQVEPEIACVIGRDLLPRSTSYDEEDIRDAVKEARFVLEVLGSRYTEFPNVPFPENLADSIANAGLFVGPAVRDPWRNPLGEFPITVTSGGKLLLTRDGRHPDRHPLRPLHWLANYLAQQGTPLREGMIVTTGSYCGIVEVPLGETLTFTFGDLGGLSATFVPK
jgi:2-keto-4-pentenoate hydratase